MQTYPACRHNLCFLTLLIFACSMVAQTKRLHPDVQNIGNRDLTSDIEKLFPNMREREITLGAELSKQHEATVTLLDDVLVTDYVTSLGGRLVRHSDAKSAIDFKIVDSEQPDFTVFPAGHVFVNTGLIVAASTEAELAATLSNAIAHVAAHHSMQMLVKFQILQIQAIPAMAVAWHWSEKGPQGAVELKGIKSTYEIEADQLAVQYLWNTGYDPAAYTTALEKLSKLQPDIRERLQSALSEQHSLPDKRPYIVDSMRFETIKSHLLKRR